VEVREEDLQDGEVDGWQHLQRVADELSPARVLLGRLNARAWGSGEEEEEKKVEEEERRRKEKKKKNKNKKNKNKKQQHAVESEWNDRLLHVPEVALE
jgi:hypothetical protein